jgi:hypothetical protein
MVTMAQIMDRYLLEVAPGKSKRTYLDNVTEIGNLRAAFGEMLPEDMDGPGAHGNGPISAHQN